MKDQTVNFRHFSLFYFRKGKKVNESHEKCCDVYGGNAPKKCKCKNWFKKFYVGNFDIKGASWTGGSTEIGDDKIMTVTVKLNLRYTAQDIAGTSKVSQKSAYLDSKKFTSN